MDDIRALELFEKELNSIGMPDLWDKVYHRVQGVRNGGHPAEHSSDKHHGDLRRQYRSVSSVRNGAYGTPQNSPVNTKRHQLITVLAAAGALAVCAVISLLIVVSVRDMPADTVNITSPASNSAVTEDNIPVKKAAPHSLALCARSVRELEEKLGGIAEGDMIYEDSAYLYRFDGTGRLCAMTESESGKMIDLERCARLLIEKHFPDVSAGDCAITIDTGGEYPMLCARAELSHEGPAVTEIRMNFYTDEWQRLLGLE